MNGKNKYELTYPYQIRQKIIQFLKPKTKKDRIYYENLSHIFINMVFLQCKYDKKTESLIESIRISIGELWIYAFAASCLVVVVYASKSSHYFQSVEAVTNNVNYYQILDIDDSVCFIYITQRNENCRYGLMIIMIRFIHHNVFDIWFYWCMFFY